MYLCVQSVFILLIYTIRRIIYFYQWFLHETDNIIPGKTQCKFIISIGLQIFIKATAFMKSCLLTTIIAVLKATYSPYACFIPRFLAADGPLFPSLFIYFTLLSIPWHTPLSRHRFHHPQWSLPDYHMSALKHYWLTSEVSLYLTLFPLAHFPYISYCII